MRVPGFALLLAGFGSVLPALAQYPGHTLKSDDKKPAPPRATAVLEWTGDPGKPKASRIVPVAVFVDGKYQDGGLYLAQPAPLAVSSDTVYELQQAGVPQGTFNIAGGEDIQGAWFGYGQWKPLPPPKPVKKLPLAKVPARVVQDNDPDRPQFKGSGGGSGGASGTTSGGGQSTGSTTSSAPTSDPDKPTLRRRTDSGNGSGDASASSNAGTASGAASGNGSTASDDNDPDKPTLHRRSDSSSSSQASPGAGTVPDDPDRPHLTKHSDESASSASSGDDVASVGAAKNIDPDRPQMMRGGGQGEYGKALQASKLTGMPTDLKQMAAVSDSATHEDHPFAYQWVAPEDATNMQKAVEALAIKAALNPDAGEKPLGAKTPTSPPPARPGAPRNTLARRVAPKPPPVVLSDEVFRAYELTYSGGPTLVLTAKATIGPNNAGTTVERYVTIIAQPDFDNLPQVRLQSVTDAQHLDITPRMKLVDAVDTKGNNEAELLFELRRANDRQFAIYRVRGLQAEQAFATEPLPYGTSGRVETSAN